MAKKLLLFSYSCFSNTGANGITMKNLLSAWPAEEKAEFYCEPKAPDFTAAHQYFRVTDVQAIKSFFGKKSNCVFNWCAEEERRSSPTQSQTVKKPGKISRWLKKHKYNFVLRWVREYAWILGPWGKKIFWTWLEDVSPDLLFYMVGESIFMDRLVLQVCEKTGLPLALYNSEAYRLIDLNQRKGLERLYYGKIQRLYELLAAKASLIVYNSDMLKADYEKRYPQSAKGMVAYNGAQVIDMPYEPQENVTITYFGNLGVGRTEELLRVSKVLEKVDASLKLHIYGSATQEQLTQFHARENIRFHGFVDAQQLRQVISQSDILVHVESFDKDRIPKMRYAFSTKIAQCLCSGRAFISFAPTQIASSHYLQSTAGALLVSTEEALEEMLRKLITDCDFRTKCAQDAQRVGMRNHQTERIAQALRAEL